MGSSGRERDEWEGLSLDDEFVGAAAIVELSADERRSEAIRKRFEAEGAAERVARKVSIRKARRLRRMRKAMQVGVAASLIGGAVTWAMFAPEGSGRYDVLSGEWSSKDVPSQSKESKDKPIGQPAPIPGLDDRYVYIEMQRGGKKPVAYDPCRPIHYVTNTRTMPAGDSALVGQAIAEASRVTGLVFIDDGPTDEVPTLERAGYDPERYGDKWSPVLISWTDPTEVPRLAGPTVGLGGSLRLETTGPTGFEKPKSVYVTGTISLDGPQFAGISSSLVATKVAIIKHELGHLLGLNHVDDSTQLMYKEQKDVVTYGNGDLNGLAQLGAGDCFPFL